MRYDDFLANKLHASRQSGFAPTFRPSFLFDFQSSLVEWATLKGKGAIYADCGLGKTPIQLVWGQNVVERTNRPVLVVAPLACAGQTIEEAQKFHIPAVLSRDGKHRGIAQMVVTNYEKLHLFNATDFAGVVCDESSILKNFDGVTRQAVTEFLRTLDYRLLCTATAAPNDYIELGTSSEALGELGYTDMLGVFFKNDESSLKPLSHASKWRFKPHAERDFWRWLCSWARALRKPSDLGFDDGRFLLPELVTTIDIVAASRPFTGNLFVLPAQTLQEQREERRATIHERCEAVARHADTRSSFVAWCHLNDEADLLEKMIPGARQVSGQDSDEEKEELFHAFKTGQLRVLITKPKIGAFGLNWQHCAEMSFFPSHSYEQYYQAVRRCWRFGQTQPVQVHVVSTAGEADVLGTLQRKAVAADAMFAAMVEHLHDTLKVQSVAVSQSTPTLPPWMAVKEPAHVA